MSKIVRMRQAQYGLSLATALFVITVMGLLAVVIFQLVRNNAETTEEQVLLVRAFYAAETGVQLGLNRVFPPAGGAGTCPFTALPLPAASMGVVTYNLEEAGLNACSAEVECTKVTVDGKDYVTVRSTGTCGDVSRTIQVRAQ